MNYDKPFRPAQFTEHALIQSILDGTYPFGSALPAERKLAEQLGVTRPTIREALQRLAGEGWITICHGKPTQINNYWETGGLRLLGTMARHRAALPQSFIVFLLELREILIPPIARFAVLHEPSLIYDKLAEQKKLKTPESFTEFDWQLQQLMAVHSGNPIYPMILNDFTLIFQTMGISYFIEKEARQASLTYYRNLQDAIEQNNIDFVENIVRGAMKQSIIIWKQVKKLKAKDKQ
jgi:GntR family negative regulator for fad regulon and positive regulator of fabA